MLKRLICLTLIFSVGCAHRPSTPRDTANVTQTGGATFASREAEVGKQIHEAIISSFRVYTEPRLVHYVGEVGKTIAEKAERHDLQYRFTVLYDERIYATEAPGGFVYITTGFINYLENESELAAVLAHEVAELQYHDPRFISSRRALEALTKAGAVASPFLGQFGVLAAAGLMLLSTVTQPRDSSEADRLDNADREALNYMVASEYDPQGYLDLMYRVFRVSPILAPYLHDYTTSRPMTRERYQWVLHEFERLPLTGKTLAVNRDRFLDMTKGVREIYH